MTQPPKPGLPLSILNNTKHFAMQCRQLYIQKLQQNPVPEHLYNAIKSWSWKTLRPRAAILFAQLELHWQLAPSLRFNIEDKCVGR